ncbi:hypothetical protein [Leisingera sp. JC1]|uniref:hypothetical protein n=1 Tax=Leisingera sp. JC1 TaxID=1855282 RepID=UPI001C2FC210|nr:hypothetical protein [Leisingera sp. JC1]
MHKRPFSGLQELPPAERGNAQNGSGAQGRNRQEYCKPNHQISTRPSQLEVVKTTSKKEAKQKKARQDQIRRAS